MNRVIVSRHPATVTWIQKTFPTFASAKVITGNATEADVTGKFVIGNLPLNLAVHARAVGAVEFTGIPPRGNEYGESELIAAGVRVRWYSVNGGWEKPQELELQAQGCAGYRIGEKNHDGTAVCVEYSPPTDCMGGFVTWEFQV